MTSNYMNKTTILRDIARNKLQMELFFYGITISNSPLNIENYFYIHARTCEEYLVFMAKFILNIRKLAYKKRNLIHPVLQIDYSVKIILKIQAINNIIFELNCQYLTALEKNYMVLPFQNNNYNFINKMPQYIVDRKIWCGLIEFHNKHISLINLRIKKYEIKCEMFGLNREMDVFMQYWPEKLILTYITMDTIAPLLSVITEMSYKISLNFVSNNQEIDLTVDFMKKNICGFIQINANSNSSIMIVMYLEKLRMFMGFFPFDQNKFLNDFYQYIDKNITINHINIQWLPQLIPLKHSLNLNQNPILNSLLNK